MEYILTNFAHGNGPYCRTVDLVIAYNDIREKNGMERLPAIFPLVPSYAFKGKEPGSRQIQFMKETVEEAAGIDFLTKHPYEFLLDQDLGTILDRVLFKDSDYECALRNLITNFEKNRDDLLRLFEKGKREVRTLEGEIASIDLKDTELAFEFNNRINTEHPNAIYINGGAGYFVEVLKRALGLSQLQIDNELIKTAIPFAERLTKYQKLHFISDPGVFSYDAKRIKRCPTEIHTPPQIHVPKVDNTNLLLDGIYVVVTGIKRLAESGIYDIASQIGLQVYSNDKEFNERFKGIYHPPFKIANPRIKAQVARTGWSSVWQIHMLAEHGLNVGLLYPKYEPKDDPEILMNNLGVENLGLGAEIDHSNPQKSLEKAIALAENNGKFNQALKAKYGTLDGIDYTAKVIADLLEGKNTESYQNKNPILN